MDAKNSLALLLREQGLYAEAEALFREVLASNEATFGPDHTNTLAVVGNLAMLFENQGGS